MNEKPILFQDCGVRAILAGVKTQTRRVFRFPKKAGDPDPNPYDWIKSIHPDGQGNWVLWSTDSPDLADFTKKAYPNGEGLKCPYGRPGDRLWVRERWRLEELESGEDGTRYRADMGFKVIENSWEAGEDWSDVYFRGTTKWRSSIYMPRWASRITLEITNIRVERVQSISWNDCLAEGIEEDPDYKSNIAKIGKGNSFYPKIVYKHIWNSINDQRGYGWNSNPWVFAITFKMV